MAVGADGEECILVSLFRDKTHVPSSLPRRHCVWGGDVIIVGNQEMWHRRVIKWIAFGFPWEQGLWVHGWRIMRFGEGSAFMYQFICLSEYWKMWQDMTVTFKLLIWKPDLTDALWYFIMMCGSDCSPYADNLYFPVMPALWKSTCKRKKRNWGWSEMQEAGKREHSVSSSVDFKL